MLDQKKIIWWDLTQNRSESYKKPTVYFWKTHRDPWHPKTARKKTSKNLRLNFLRNSRSEYPFNMRYASVRPFLYVDHFHIFDRSTSTFLLRLADFDLCTATFCQIWTSYWWRSTGRSTVLAEVKFVQKCRSKV